jgi:hypothetical protein
MSKNKNAIIKKSLRSTAGNIALANSMVDPIKKGLEYGLGYSLNWGRSSQQKNELVYNPQIHISKLKTPDVFKVFDDLRSNAVKDLVRDVKAMGYGKQNLLFDLQILPADEPKLLRIGFLIVLYIYEPAIGLPKLEELADEER